jgi:hypothetical protein
MTEKLYLQYAELLSEISIAELEMNEKKRALSELKTELDKDREVDGSLGLEVTAHAFTNIAERLAILASENPAIHADVMNVKEPSKAILWPSNLKAFVIGTIANAKLKKNYTEKPSRNSPGKKEYHYEIELNKWGTDSEELHFTAVVENNVVKTGFFNWYERK